MLETPQADKVKNGERMTKKAKTRSTQTVQNLPCVLVITVVYQRWTSCKQCLYGAILLAYYFSKVLSHCVRFLFKVHKLII